MARGGLATQWRRRRRCCEQQLRLRFRCCTDSGVDVNCIDERPRACARHTHDAIRLSAERAKKNRADERTASAPAPRRRRAAAAPLLLPRALEEDVVVADANTCPPAGPLAETGATGTILTRMT